MNPGELSIDARDIVKSYDGHRNAVDGVSFSVEKGEIYGLLGKNGAGKTTIIKILTTLITPTSGQVSICGLDIRKKASQVRKIIGVVQQGESFDFTTVEKSFRVYALLWEIPRSRAERMAEELIEFFDLKDIRNKRMFDLSGGQKKRVQVAREFMHDMEVLFLDEPTVGMDPIMRRSVLNFIREKSRDGLTVIFTTHLLDEADYLCRKIGMVNNGKMMAEGTPEDLKKRFESMRKLSVTVKSLNDNKQIEALKTKIGSLKGAIEVSVKENKIDVLGLNMGKVLSDLVQILNNEKLEVDQVTLDNPSLDDVFIQVMKN